MANIIDIDRIKNLILNDDIETATISRLSGINAQTLYNYRNGSTGFGSMTLDIAMALQHVIDDPNIMSTLVGLPRGIDAVLLKSGGVSYKVSVSLEGKKVYVGTYYDKSRAIAKQNEFIFKHRDKMRSKRGKKVASKVDAIEVTPELAELVKATRGVSFYKDRTKRVTGFRAEYMRDGKRVYLGKFPTFEAAKAALDKADPK